VRAGVLAVCRRLRARLPHLTGDDLRVVDEELRTALEALASHDERS
jgi:phage terminase Nu1 subunit (DNA packaging protein)